MQPRLINKPPRLRRQRGVALVEALVGILIFAFGIVGLVGLQVAMTRAQGSAKYRADAAYLSSQALGAMWADRRNLAKYNSGTDCNPTRLARTGAKVESECLRRRRTQHTAPPSWVHDRTWSTSGKDATMSSRVPSTSAAGSPDRLMTCAHRLMPACGLPTAGNSEARSAPSVRLRRAGHGAWRGQLQRSLHLPLGSHHSHLIAHADRVFSGAAVTSFASLAPCDTNGASGARMPCASWPRRIVLVPCARARATPPPLPRGSVARHRDGDLVSRKCHAIALHAFPRSASRRPGSVP